jgi:pimeloyl-ACP methyl ester carboxylesterase
MSASLLEWPVADETGVADNAGVRVAWRRYGDGPDTILFIPTWNFVDSRVLRHQVDGLRDQCRVITYDARGSGLSDRPSSGYSFDNHVEDALAVLDATDTPGAVVVAASFGTHVAVLLAGRHPERVRRLVLVAPPMDVPGFVESSDAAEPSAEPDWRTDYEAFVPWFINAVFPEPNSQGTIDQIVRIALDADRAVLRQQADELDWDEAPRKLGEVRCPTLVIHGAADRTLNVDAVKAVARALPNGRLVLLEDLGHRPDIRRPDIVNPLLIEFVWE